MHTVSIVVLDGFVPLDVGILLGTVRTVFFGNPNHRETAVKSLPTAQTMLRPLQPAGSNADEMVAVRAHR